MQKLIEDIADWIKEQVEQAGKKGVVLGLSGGLDSTVAAFICKKALNEQNILAIVMPCHSEEKSLKDAEIAADFLKTPTQYIDLSPVYDSFLSILPEASQTEHANLKARLRMATLYYFANKSNYLVVGTSNKSERSVGYFTKYGDGAADILPLADIHKTELIQVAKEINVPQRIINKPPSADLWQGQTDEDELGITYKELDEILNSIERNEKLADIDKEKLVKGLIQKSIHKRQSPSIFKRKG